jgi:hypothetical protein
MVEDTLPSNIPAVRIFHHAMATLSSILAAWWSEFQRSHPVTFVSRICGWEGSECQICFTGSVNPAAEFQIRS